MDAVPEDLLRQRDFLRRLARALTGDAAAAEDVVQEVELRALTRAPASGPLGAWLTTVTRRLAANVRRARVRREEHEHGAARTERVEGPFETLAGLELQERVLAAVRSLEEPYRTTLWLRYYEDLGPVAIAQRTDAPLASVKTRLARGLALLRARLDGEHGGRREAWALALAPLAARAGPALAPLTLGGVLTMKKLALGVVILVVAWVGWRAATRPSMSAVSARAEAASPLAPALAPPALVATGTTRAQGRDELSAEGLRNAPEAPAAASLVVEVHWEQDGAPAPGMGLILLPTEGGALELRAREIRTDAAGHARLEGVASGAWVLHDERGGELELVLAPGEERHVDLLLPTMLSVAGRVVDPEGRGVAGAEVWLERLWGASRGSPLLDGRVVARTDEDGAFRLRGLRVENALGAFAPGFAPAPLALLRTLAPFSGASELEVELVLARGPRRLAGRVLDAGGVPMAGALIALGTRGNVVRGEHWKARARVLVSDEEGRFAADWIAADWGVDAPQLALTVLAPEHALLLVPSAEVFAALDGELVLHLLRGAVVRGRARSATGQPVEYANVEVLVCGESNRASVPFALPSARANAQGEYELLHVTSGAVQMAAWAGADPGLRALRTGELLDAAEHIWDLRLGELAAIRGRVVDEAGLPVAGRSVLVGDARSMSGVTSGADGTFQFLPESADSEWTLSLVGSSGFDDQRTGVKLGQEVVLIARAHTGVVVGTFRDDVGAATAGQALRAELMTVGAVLLATQVELDGAGAFRFENVAPGDYQLQITCGENPLATSAEFTLEAGGFRDVGELVSR